jgi:hypothetical protein
MEKKAAQYIDECYTGHDKEQDGYDPVLYFKRS